ncbi:MAG: hypothetical protein ACE5JH_05340 [Acidobacteriota bacterium]
MRPRRPHRPTGGGPDPGAAWVDTVLAPLRRQEAACDVSRAVMARVGASRSHLPPAAGRPLSRPRLAVAVWLLGTSAGFAAFAAALATLAVEGDRGTRQLVTVLASVGRSFLLLGESLAALAAGFLTAALALLRWIWRVVETAAPLLRGAGTLGAASGVLAILVSLYLFTHACRAAPPVSGGLGPKNMGGIR